MKLLPRSIISLLAALMLVGLLVMPATAVDDGYPEPENDTPVVNDDVLVEDEVVEDEVIADEVAVEDEATELQDTPVEADDEVSALAFSGSNTTPLVLGGLVLAMLGGLLLILARRRTSAE